MSHTRFPGRVQKTDDSLHIAKREEPSCPVLHWLRHGLWTRVWDPFSTPKAPAPRHVLTLGSCFRDLLSKKSQN